MNAKLLGLLVKCAFLYARQPISRELGDPSSAWKSLIGSKFGPNTLGGGPNFGFSPLTKSPINSLVGLSSPINRLGGSTGIPANFDWTKGLYSPRNKLAPVFEFVGGLPIVPMSTSLTV